jgi:hypothetical protein
LANLSLKGVREIDQSVSAHKETDMAEIRIESRARLWPRLLMGIVLLVLVAWWLHARREREVVTETRGGTVFDTGSGTVVGTAEGTPSSVNDFLRFVAESGERFGSALPHPFTADGIRHLGAALGAMGEADSASAGRDARARRRARAQ